MDSRASRQGNAIAGLEASAWPACLGFWAWNCRVAFCCFAVAGLEAVEDCRVIAFRSGLGRLETIRAAATILRIEFMVFYMRFGSRREDGVLVNSSGVWGWPC